MPESVDDAALRAPFARFGAIVSARSFGASKGYGYVNFASADAAHAAAKALSNKDVFRAGAGPIVCVGKFAPPAGGGGGASGTSPERARPRPAEGRRSRRRAARPPPGRLGSGSGSGAPTAAVARAAASAPSQQQRARGSIASRLGAPPPAAAPAAGDDEEAYDEGDGEYDDEEDYDGDDGDEGDAGDDGDGATVEVEALPAGVDVRQLMSNFSSFGTVVSCLAPQRRGTLGCLRSRAAAKVAKELGGIASFGGTTPLVCSVAGGGGGDDDAVT